MVIDFNRLTTARKQYLQNCLLTCLPCSQPVSPPASPTQKSIISFANEKKRLRENRSLFFTQTTDFQFTAQKIIPYTILHASMFLVSHPPKPIKCTRVSFFPLPANSNRFVLFFAVYLIIFCLIPLLFHEHRKRLDRLRELMIQLLVNHCLNSECV